MSKSLILVGNNAPQAVEANGIINLGTTLRRFGCNLRQSGNGVEVTGTGYYDITASVSVSPTATGAVTVAIYEDGAVLPSAIAYGTASTAEAPINLCLVGTSRIACGCNSKTLTCVLVEGAGTVENVALRVEKA